MNGCKAEMTYRMMEGFDMKRLWITAILVAALCAVQSPSIAQEQDRGRSARISTMSVSSLDGLLGKEVTNRQGHRLAHVGGVVLEGNRVLYLILYLAEPGGTWRHVPVPASMAELRVSDGAVVLDLEKRLLTEAPSYYAPERPDFSDLEWEQHIHSYYGERPPDQARESYVIIRR